MKTQYGIGNFSIKSDGAKFVVFCKDEALSEFPTYEDAADLLRDLHLSQKASDDSLIGSLRFCPAMVGNGNAVVVVAKVDDGYLVQRAGTKDRMVIAEEYLSDMPTLFAEVQAPPVPGMGVSPDTTPPVETAAAPEANDEIDVRQSVDPVDQSITYLIPVTAEAKTWIEEHIDENAEWHRGGLMVEQSYVKDIVDAMKNNGLAVQEAY